MKVPILFIIFKRPETTFKVFEKIRKVKPKKLFIAADGPRTDYSDDIEKTGLCRSVVQKIDWDCEVRTLFRNKNIGCGIGVSEAIIWFFEHNDEGIILEDDCVPDLSFFEFCSEMLERYRYDERIISINGCNLGYSSKGNESYFFSRFMNMWGWATWKRAAIKIDYDLKDWQHNRHKLFSAHQILKQNILDADINWYKLWVKKFNKVIDDKNFTWDWQWSYYQLKNKLYSVIPSKNLISNIGFDNFATHTNTIDNPAANIDVESMEFPIVHPAKIKLEQKYEEEYIKWVWCSHKRIPFKNYIGSRIKSLFRQN